MRIASVSTYYPGPGQPFHGLFVQRRLEAMAQHADVRVLHLKPWFPLLRPCPADELRPLPGEGLPVERRRMFYWPGVLKGLDAHWLCRAALPALRALDTEEKLDLIDAHFGYPAGVGCVLAARKLNRPVFVTLHGVEEDILGRRWRGWQLRCALTACTGVVSVAQSLCDVAAAHGVPREKIRVIPYAVDRQTFHPGPRDEARRQLQIPEDGRLLVSVGMFEHRKGHHLVLFALKRLLFRMPDVRLAIVGDKTHETKYQDRIRWMVDTLDLSDHVLLPGPQPSERVAIWLRAADLFVLATYYEAHCNAVLEALACGLPVVTTPVGDNAALVDPPRRGMLVPVDDAAALAVGVEKALGDAWDRERIAGYGAERSWDTVARQTLDYFRERLAALPRSNLSG